MANIAVNQFTFKPIVDMGTIIVSVFADGKLIKDLEFSLSGYTTDTAVASARNTAENFGILGPGNVDLYEKSTTPTTAPPEGAATPEVKVSAFTTTFAGKANSTLKAGDTYTVSLFGDGVLIKQVPFTAAGKYANPFKAQQDVKFDAEQAGALSSDGKTKYISGTSTPKSATTVYKYEIKKFGPRKYIVVYEISSTGEKEIYQSQQLIGLPDDKYVETAKLGLEGQYPGVKDMTPKTPPPPTVPKTEPPIEPAPSPLPKNLQTDEPPKYIPAAAYKKAKNTTGGEFIVKDTGEEYKGPYIETGKKQYLAGETPEQNGVELEKLEKAAGLPDLSGLSLLGSGLSLFALLQSAFKKQLSQDEVNKGLAKRYFVQDNRTNKISETSEEAFNQAKTDLPNFKLAEVDWNIRTPAEDVVINGVKFQGSESRNKEAIKNLESQLPGISNFVTDFKYLVPEAPAPANAVQVETQVISTGDRLLELQNSRKANFDLRK